MKTRKIIAIALVMAVVILMCPITVLATVSSPDDVTISQNSDGSLSITSSDTAYIAGLNSLDLSNDTTTLCTINFQDSEYASREANQITIGLQWLLDNGIMSGTYSIDYYASEFNDLSVENALILTQGYQNVSENVGLTLMADLALAPADLSIIQNSDGSISITTSDAAYIAGLKSFDIYNDLSGCFINFTDNENVTKETCKLTVGLQELLNNGIMSGTYSVRYYALGYQSLYMENKLILTQGAAPAPDDVAIIQNTDGSIAITSSDSTYLAAMTSLNLSNEVYERYIYFQNNSNITRSVNQININLQEIIDNGITAGTYSVRYYAPGYQNLYVENGLILTHGAALAPDDVAIIQNSDGSISITSSDSTYLAAMKSLELRYEMDWGDIYFQNNSNITRSVNQININLQELIDNGITAGTYSVSYYASGYQSLYVENGLILTQGAALAPADVAIIQNSDGSIYITSSDSTYLAAMTSLELSSEMNWGDINFQNNSNITRSVNQININLQELIDNGIAAGTYSVRYYAPGYQNLYVENGLILTQGAALAPADVAIIQNGDGSISITSSDAAYISGLKSLNIYNDLSWYSINFTDNTNITKETYKLTVGLQEILNNGIMAGTYSASFDAAGYHYMYMNSGLTLTQGAALAPDDVAITPNTDGSISITSSDSTYLAAMTSLELSNEMNWGHINFQNNSNITRSVNQININLQEIIDNCFTSGTYSVRYYAPGYQSLDTANGLILTQGAALTPDDVAIIQNADGSISITSSDAAYIAGLKFLDLYNESSDFFINFTDNANVTRGTNNLTIGLKELIDNGITNDYYFVSGYVNGYQYLNNNLSIAFMPATVSAVTFNSQGGSAIASISANYGTKISLPTAPTKAGYIFGGWYKNAICTQAWFFNSDMITKDTILYAKWTLSNTGAFITRFYDLCLGRSADAGGLEYWASSLQAGSLTGANAAYNFVFSTEFLNRNVTDSEYLSIMYHAFFNRNPDAGGAAYWQGYLDNGMSRYWILVNFVNSTEFNNICNTYGITVGSLAITAPVDKYPQITQFVTRFYKLCLNRMPDAAGLDHWVVQLQTQNLAGANVAHDIVTSEEFTNRGTTNDEFVEIMYKAFFDRTSEASGKAYWTGRLAAGTSRYTVLAGFVNSQEFTDICSTYGINRGSM